MSVFIGALFLAGSLQTVPHPVDPDSIVNGTDATVCEFPAAVAMLNSGFPTCTGVLVHPRVVMTAAHCVDNNLDQIAFGEDSFDAEFTVGIEACEAHPAYFPDAELNGIDLGFCTLTADAPEVPIVPPLVGCEADQLTAGAEVILAGFGVDDELGSSGGGTKRWTPNTVEALDADNNLFLLGEASASACFGDSGGPAYMQLADGSWRVVGITSQTHPDVPGPLACGYGATYELVHLEMAWLEEASGYDVTPCFDPDGTWTPDENCGNFATSLTTADVTWPAACVGADVSGFSETCGEAFQPSGTTGTTGGSDTGESSSSEGGETSGGLTTGEESGASEDSTTTTTTGPEPDPTTETSGAPPDLMESGDGGGCGCRLEDPLPRGVALSWLLLLGIRRRRVR